MGAPPAPRRDSAARLFADYAGSRALTSLLSIATVAFLTRTVPIGSYGTYVTAVSFALILWTFLDLGNNQGLVRNAAGSGDEAAAIATYLRARALLVAATLVAGLLGVLVLFDAESRPAGFIALGLVVASGPGGINPIGQVLGSMRAYRIAMVMQSVGGLVATVVAVAVLDLRSPEPLVAATVLAAAMASAYAYGWAWRTLGRPGAGHGWAAARRQLRAASLLGVAVVLASISYRIGGVLVLRLDGDREAALFGVATRIMDQARLIPTALLIPLGPLVAHRLARGGIPAELDRRLDVLAGAGGAALALAVIATADLAVLAVAGPDYDRAATLAILLATTLSFAGYAYTGMTKLTMGYREREYVVIVVAGLASSVVLGLALIPPHGAAGAAAAAMVTELGVALGLAALARGQGVGARTRAVLAVSLLALAAAAAKLWAVERGLAANLAVSALLLAAAVPPALRAARSLRALPPVHEAA